MNDSFNSTTSSVASQSQSNRGRNSSKISIEQREMMVAFMESNNKFVEGKFSASFTQDMYSELWKDLAAQLNSLGSGANKTVKQWKKCLADWKSLTKAKVGRILESQKGTGGGPQTNEKLTDLENRLQSIVGWTAATGSLTIKEGGFPQSKRVANNLSVPSCSSNVPVREKSALEQIIYYDDEDCTFSLTPEQASTPPSHSTPRNSPGEFLVPRTPPRRRTPRNCQNVSPAASVASTSQPRARRRLPKAKAPYSRELRQNSTEDFFKVMQELQARQTNAAEETLKQYEKMVKVKEDRLEVEREKAEALSNIAQACYQYTKRYLRLNKTKDD